MKNIKIDEPVFRDKPLTNQDFSSFCLTKSARGDTVVSVDDLFDKP